jgi:aminoglycoside phosphotransferase (APT) family kinase protein
MNPDPVATDPTDPAQRLQRFLGTVRPGEDVQVIDYELLPGGMSRVIARAEVRWADGSRQKLVVRSDPEAEGLFRSDRDAEWRLLKALNTVEQVRTPRALWYDATGEHFGAKTIVTDFSDGANMHHLIQDHEDLDQRADLFVDTVAAIHHVPLDALPPEMGTRQTWDEYVDDALDTYARAEHSLAANLPVFRYLSARLRHTERPPEVPLVLVHGDAQPGNVLIEPGAQPLVIDWEFSRVGDPREDLGYYAQIPMPPNLYGLDPERYLARYRSATGLTEEQVNPDTVDYFRAVGMAALLIQIAEGSDALARGGRGGILTTYLINALSYNWEELFRATQRVSRQSRVAS